MTSNFNLDDLYQIILKRLRKDRKGGVSPEDFEAFLRIRNMDYFNQMMGQEGMSNKNTTALSPFYQFHEADSQLNIISASGLYLVGLAYLNYDWAEIMNVYHSASYSDLSSLTEVDLVTSAEWSERIGNAITGPSESRPIAIIGDNALNDDDNMYVSGVTTGYLVFDYYRYPVDPYFDYYVDASGNYTYLTDGQGAYTLQAGEVARDGTAAGGSVTSASQDLEWKDTDAMNILDMVYTDVVVALSDPGSYQASILERQQNVKS